MAQQYSGRVASDYGKYSPFLSESGYSAPDSAWHPVYGVGGSGYLAKAILVPSSGTFSMRVTVDDVVKILLTSASLHIIGFIMESNILSAGSTDGARIRSPQTSSISWDVGIITGMTEDNGDHLIISNQPIFYRKGILIEIKADVASAVCNYGFNGGVA